ncbi:platelet-derived growth factor receptor-like protein [Anarrhichthys ocellatus]|uniref:platelet-derived growth factor receptor-like protein n=1 Tax=Anarrhichthys ocellatus TaxID=433405 RepID=UPI0012ED8360|nr:platelet-derived growth factor receptor-like protein [Anarrhichthys ocellatus]XP_031714036.1 platelet-derived growth factor receptor-like protein [Anarrhichthys ocellatus]XP_031714037.1 platelet-derived growth factor receptor-like protein [Anarrhichthys ocellatus]
MKLWVVFCLALLWVELQNGACQQVKRRKDVGENRIRPGGKRVKARPTKPKDGGGKGQSLLTQVLDKGRFLRLGPSTTLTPGRDMELRCKGNSIGWSYPTYLDIFNDSRLSIIPSDKYSQLILTSPSAADTGPYSCWVIVCDGTECERDHDRTYVSYIYFTDKDNLFVPSAIHFEIVYLRPDRPAVVPCRVTDPQAKVSLHREVPPEEIPANGTQVTYDPTKGFVLQSPSLEHQGVFYCKAVTKGTPQISTKYQLLYVEVPSGPPFVSLDASPESVGGGDNVDVTCTVLGEPEVDVSFTWSYPGQGRRPVHTHTSWRLVNRGISHTTRISQSVLTVEDMETIDFGNYICKAKNRNGETIVTTNIISK